MSNSYQKLQVFSNLVHHILVHVIGTFKLDSSSHGNVRVGIVIVHARATTDCVHGTEEIVQEDLVVRIGSAFVVRFDHGHNECHITGGDVVAVTIFVVLRLGFQVFWINGEWGQINGAHGSVDLCDRSTSVRTNNAIE